MTQPTNLVFTFEKTYKEIDIAGELHRIDFDDEARLKYQKAIKSFSDLSKVAQDKLNALGDIDNVSDELIEQSDKEQKELVKGMVETFLGDGSFDSLYEKAGRSVINLMGLVSYLTELYTSEISKTSENSRLQYLNNKKKNV